MIYAHAPSPLFYTLIGSLSDDPEFARLDWMLSSIVQVFVETVHIARAEIFFYLILIFLASFISSIIL